MLVKIMKFFLNYNVTVSKENTSNNTTAANTSKTKTIAVMTLNRSPMALRLPAASTKCPHSNTKTSLPSLS